MKRTAMLKVETYGQPVKFGKVVTVREQPYTNTGTVRTVVSLDGLPLVTGADATTITPVTIEEDD